jgi:hypothetical protein
MDIRIQSMESQDDDLEAFQRLEASLKGEDAHGQRTRQQLEADQAAPQWREALEPVRTSLRTRLVGTQHPLARYCGGAAQPSAICDRRGPGRRNQGVQCRGTDSITRF